MMFRSLILQNPLLDLLRVLGANDRRKFAEDLQLRHQAQNDHEAIEQYELGSTGFVNHLFMIGNVPVRLKGNKCGAELVLDEAPPEDDPTTPGGSVSNTNPAPEETVCIAIGAGATNYGISVAISDQNSLGTQAGSQATVALRGDNNDDPAPVLVDEFVFKDSDLECEEIDLFVFPDHGGSAGENVQQHGSGDNFDEANLCVSLFLPDYFDVG